MTSRPESNILPISVNADDVPPERPGNDIDNELVVLDPSHPLMSRFQLALKKQLSKQRETLDQEIREASDVLKRFKHEREDVGVLLYGVQQELAKQQTELECCQDEIEAKRQARIKAEQDLKAQKQVFEHANEELTKQLKSNNELQLQIEQLTQKIQYLEAAKREITSDVKTLHRATTKAGSELAAAELDKRRQDMFVDRLTSTVEKLNDEKRKYLAQIQVQEKETAAYREMLSEARTEIESIELDKKRLMQQWDSSVISMRKRDELYNEKTKECNAIIESRQALGMEVIGLKKNILALQNQNEALHEQFMRVENDFQATQRKITQTENEKNNMLQQFSEMTKVLNATEDELKVNEVTKINLENKIKGINREIELQHNENKKTEAMIDQFIQEKQTAHQASNALQKEIAQVSFNNGGSKLWLG